MFNLMLASMPIFQYVVIVHFMMCKSYVTAPGGFDGDSEHSLVVKL